MFRLALVSASLVSLIVAAVPARAAFPGRNGALLISASTERTASYCPAGPPRVVARIADEPDCSMIGAPYAVYLAGPGRSLVRWLDADVWSAGTFTAWGTSVVLNKGRTSDGRLYVVSAVPGAHPVSLHRRGDAPAISADGRWIAYRRWDADGNGTSVWIASTRGGPPRLVSADGSNPRWSNQGRLAFTGSTGVMVTAVGGRHPRRVASGQFEDWAPSGHQLLLTRTAYDPAEDVSTATVFAAGVDGRRPRRLTSVVEGGVRSAVWSPDGRKIAFHRAWNDDIYLISARGRSRQGPHSWHKIITDADALHDWQPLR